MDNKGKLVETYKGINIIKNGKVFYFFIGKDMYGRDCENLEIKNCLYLAKKSIDLVLSK